MFSMDARNRRAEQKFLTFFAEETRMPLLKISKQVPLVIAAVVLAACGGGDGAAVINQPSSFTAQSGVVLISIQS